MPALENAFTLDQILETRISALPPEKSFDLFVTRRQRLCDKALGETSSQIKLVFDEVNDGDARTPNNLPLLEAAWESGNTERCVNVSTDPAMAEWTSVAMRKGVRSGVAIPLRLAKGATFAVLMLYSALPGGYSSAEQASFIDLLKTLLALAISRCASLEGGASAIPHSTRNRWKALLRSDALQMYCQPIVELKTGRVTKVEMLARLNDGSRLLTPYEFFPGARFRRLL